jgi:flagellar biosynthesis/type III secretory pathway M-ring protein FliF/YscJ
VKFLTTSTQEEIDLSRLLPADLVKADAEAEAAAALEGGKKAAKGGEDDESSGDSVKGGGAASETEKKKSGLPDLDSSIDFEQFEEVVAENARLVKENPQQAALLIRYWLNDGKL